MSKFRNIFFHFLYDNIFLLNNRLSTIITKMTRNNMRNLIVVLVALALIIPSEAAFTHLADKNFYEKINSSPFTFVYFYSSSCQYCKEFTPKFEKLSKSKDLQKLGVQFGKMDATMYKNFTQKFEVFAYPTLAIFFKDVSLPIIYRKQRQENAIFNFILKIIQPSNTSKLIEHYHNLTPDQIYVNKLAIFNGKFNSQQFLTWDVLVKRDGFIEWSFNESDTTSLVIGQHTITDFSDPFELELAVQRFYAKLHDVTEESWTKMAEKKKFTVVYMNKHENKKTLLLLAKLSRELRNVHFINIGGQDENWGSALRYLGINDEQNIIAVDRLYDVLYIAPAPYSQNSLREFVQKAQKHQLDIYRKSQKSDKLNKLTRENYEERMSTKQDVLLFLYDRGDAISKQLMNLFEFLKVKLKTNTNLLLLRCDVKLNEIQQKLGFVIQRTPRLVFFRNRQKDYPIHFSGKTISAKTVIDFILENTTFDFQDEWAEL